jgi:hypothetical protein
MRLIGVGEWERVETAERAVFRAGVDVRGAARSEPFTGRMERRVVLALDGDLFPARDAATIDALTTAARKTGDEEAFRRGEAARQAVREPRPALGIAYGLAAESRDFTQPFIAGWRSGFNFDRYRGRGDRFVSPSGAWGLIFDEAGWALLGGTSVFMEAFVTAYPGSLADEFARHVEWCRAYAAERSDPASIDWLPAHLAAIVGGERAERLLVEIGAGAAGGPQRRLP